MTPEEVLDYYGTKTEIARRLGAGRTTVVEWFALGAIPEGRQYQLQLATKGRLKADQPADRVSGR